MATGGLLTIRAKVKAHQGRVIQERAVQQRVERAGIRKLYRIGAYAMRSARNSLRAKRDMQVAEFPEQLRELVLKSVEVDRKKDGAVRARQSKATMANLREVIKPWPQTVSKAGEPPRVTNVITAAGKNFKPFKNLIVFAVEKPRRSTIIGPEVEDQTDLPGDLEDGGVRTGPDYQWKAIRQRGGQTVFRFWPQGVAAKRIKARPYMGPAFDRTMDALVPKIFQEMI